MEPVIRECESLDVFEASPNQIVWFALLHSVPPPPVSFDRFPAETASHRQRLQLSVAIVPNLSESSGNN